MRTSTRVGVILTIFAITIGTLTTADAHPGHSITVNNVSGGEGAGTVSFQLTVSPAPLDGETVSVSVATANGSATGVATCPGAPGNGGADYVNLPNTTITWAAGETMKTRAVSVCQDGTAEGDEYFFLNLTNASSNASIGDFQGVGTITDDEEAPALQISDRNSAEGAAGTTNFTFPVSISAPTNKTVTVHYSTEDGTATAGGDYVAKSGDLTFAPNTTADQIVSVAVTGGTGTETDETFFVNLSSPVNAKIGDPQGVGTIQNDDASPSGNTFTINNVSRAEGNAGTSPATPFTFTVTLGEPAGVGHTATVNFHVTEGTASAGSDYTFVSGTLVFPNPATAKTIAVPVIGDTNQENNETFNVNLTGADCSTTTTACSNPTISDANGAGTIVNDDGSAPPTSPPSSPPSGNPTSTIRPKAMKIAGYFQARVTASSPCQSGRTIKMKQQVSGTDKVVAQGKTRSDGVYKQAVRPKKKGKFYAQVYDFRKGSVLCKGGKSSVTTLPA